MSTDFEKNAFTSFQISELIKHVDNPDILLSIISTALHIWCKVHNEDVKKVAETLLEVVEARQEISDIPFKECPVCGNSFEYTDVCPVCGAELRGDTDV